MKIEVGKFYKTSYGRKIRIYALDAKGRYPVHGALLEPEGNWTAKSWSSEGKYLLNVIDGVLDASAMTPSDIVAEWEEPKPKLKAWIDQYGHPFFSIDHQNHAARAPWLEEK